MNGQGLINNLTSGERLDFGDLTKVTIPAGGLKVWAVDTAEDGGGGIIVEAAGLGALVTGIDMSWTLLEGAKSNLKSPEFSDSSLIQADSRHLPISRFEKIVTDPPYGRTSSTRGETATVLIEQFLKQLCRENQTPVSLCICGSSKMKLKSLIEDLGGRVKLQIPIRVHRSLIRELLLVEF